MGKDSDLELKKNISKYADINVFKYIYKNK